MLLFQIVQIVYWIALSVWFGSVLFIALAAPVIFRTVQENNPILTNVLSVNLDGQHSTLLAGTIVANLIQRMFIVEIICGSGIAGDADRAVVHHRSFGQCQQRASG
jgi:hypothetical protein